MGDLQQKDYQLQTNNVYNSFELAMYMPTQNTYICDTLRSDCKSNPKEATKSNLKKGDIVSIVSLHHCYPTWYHCFQMERQERCLDNQQHAHTQNRGGIEEKR